ncbi:hypothetical protein CCYA_CCYA02G0637 [Cyanidiococcus yangmingshanensis]|nr:hypothetical protein CCYA_CCYA02G0637 [Cyanidiococcus yangmingshanensis]
MAPTTAFGVLAVQPAARQRAALGLSQPCAHRLGSVQQRRPKNCRFSIVVGGGVGTKRWLYATQRDDSTDETLVQGKISSVSRLDWLQRMARVLFVGLATINVWSPLVRGAGLGGGLHLLFRTPVAAFAKTPHARYSRKTLDEKLAQVPVFAVTNESGQPFLAAMERGTQVGLIFFDPSDAMKMLEDLKRSSGKEAEDARIFVMGLDRAFEMVKSKPQPSGLRGPRGDELKMVFRFYPNQQQVEHARSLARKTKQPPVRGVPCFVAKGLTLRKGKEFVIPVFLDKRDLEDAWSRLRQDMSDLPKHPEVEVGDLIEVILRLEEAAKNPKSLDEKELQDIRRVAFFPSSKSVEFMKQESMKQFKGTARMHARP